QALADATKLEPRLVLAQAGSGRVIDLGAAKKISKAAVDLAKKEIKIAAEAGAGTAEKLGTWKGVVRNFDEGLKLQEKFSGKEIKYSAAGRAAIEEFDLGGVKFDRIKDGVLGELKGDYGFVEKIAKYTDKIKAIKEITDQMERQIAIARK